MSSLSATLRFNAQVHQADTEVVGESVVDGNLAYSQTVNSTNTSTYNITRQVQLGLTIAASGTSSIDLTSCTDPLGTAVNFSNVKAIIIKNTAHTTSAGTVASAANITVGGAASNAFVGFVADATDKIYVYNGQILPLIAAKSGIAVSGTNKAIDIINLSSTEAIYVEVLILGVVA